jgi:predicted RNase H-like nuclease
MHLSITGFPLLQQPPHTTTSVVPNQFGSFSAAMLADRCFMRYKAGSNPALSATN